MDERHQIGGSDFIWNIAKAESNLRNHGVRFAEAATVFLDPLLVVTDASRNDEARQAVIGFDHVGRLLYVVHVVVEEDCIRIISARQAGPKEERLYAY